LMCVRVCPLCSPGSVYERLTNPGSFTGVYRRAWETDGRINAHADRAAMRKFKGNTNAKSNTNIHDIATYVFVWRWALQSCVVVVGLGGVWVGLLWVLGWTENT